MSQNVPPRPGLSPAGSVEKYIKSSTYIPKYSGADPGIIVPEYRHGALGDGCNSIVAKAFFDFSYQCLWERFRPYSVLISRR